MTFVNSFFYTIFALKQCYHEDDLYSFNGWPAWVCQLHYNTYDDPAIRSVALSDYDTSGTELVEVGR